MYTYSRILFSLKKGNPAISNPMDEPGGQYTKWNKPDTEGKITALYHLHKASKIVKRIEAENRMVVARGWGSGKRGGTNERVQSFSCARWISPRDLLYSIEPTVNNTTVLYT